MPQFWQRNTRNQCLRDACSLSSSAQPREKGARPLPLRANAPWFCSLSLSFVRDMGRRANSPARRAVRRPRRVRWANSGQTLSPQGEFAYCWGDRSHYNKGKTASLESKSGQPSLSLPLSLFLCPSSSITLNECRKHWLVRYAFAVVAATHLPASFSHNTVHTTSRQHSDFTLNLFQPKRARKKRAGSVASASKTSRRGCMCQGDSCISTGTMDAYRAWVLFPLLFPGVVHHMPDNQKQNKHTDRHTKQTNKTTTEQQQNNHQTTTKQPPNNNQATTKQTPNNHQRTTTATKKRAHTHTHTETQPCKKKIWSRRRDPSLMRRTTIVASLGCMSGNALMQQQQSTHGQERSITASQAPFPKMTGLDADAQATTHRPWRIVYFL